MRHVRERHNLMTFLKQQGITNESVLAAIENVPRELFVDEAFSHQAYENNALPIGSGQTISQPYIVAKMTQLLALTPDSKVLEIGTMNERIVGRRLRSEAIKNGRVPKSLTGR